MENETEKTSYEVSCLLREESAVEDVVRLLNQHNVEIISQGPAKRVSLAYKIGKENQAYFSFLYFRSVPQTAKTLEQDLLRHNAVLRFLLIKIPAYKNVMAEQERRRARIAPRPEEAQPKAPQPLSNEALEKKIEEILQ